MKQKNTTNFWLGNAVLGLALVMLLGMGALWEQMGILALVLWAAVAGLGIYLVMTGGEPGGPGE